MINKLKTNTKKISILLALMLFVTFGLAACIQIKKTDKPDTSDVKSKLATVQYAMGLTEDESDETPNFELETLSVNIVNSVTTIVSNKTSVFENTVTLTLAEMDPHKILTETSILFEDGKYYKLEVDGETARPKKVEVDRYMAQQILYPINKMPSQVSTLMDGNYFEFVGSKDNIYNYSVPKNKKKEYVTNYYTVLFGKEIVEGMPDDTIDKMLDVIDMQLSVDKSNNEYRAQWLDLSPPNIGDGVNGGSFIPNVRLKIGGQSNPFKGI